MEAQRRPACRVEAAVWSKGRRGWKTRGRASMVPDKRRQWTVNGLGLGHGSGAAAAKYTLCDIRFYEIGHLS